MTVWPATEIEPTRSDELADTEKSTDPLPVPDAPRVMVIQLKVVDAVHAHVLALAVTVTLADPPASENVRLVGDTVNVHGGGGGGSGGAAACDTVNVWPAIVIVPVRADPALATTVYESVPLPFRDPLLDTMIHAALDAAVHVHDVADAVTVTVPGPPASPML